MVSKAPATESQAKRVNDRPDWRAWPDWRDWTAISPRGEHSVPRDLRPRHLVLGPHMIESPLFMRGRRPHRVTDSLLFLRGRRPLGGRRQGAAAMTHVRKESSPTRLPAYPLLRASAEFGAGRAR